ncbi:4-(cytidine 5'-diphospho)-2-C-methyl-D-erythritol kinase [Chryseosolibacter indicus]|uniref:4-diphosphocytidyl-2-C-methyl-D-erythritol kinase n=1 Tax=Chryseosolibacter indicus TaxID=2782351 RepID=A0ABS5VMP0_9BACT|nr:4-(cytidine 5'-diphospho)-2-C-methyl-D-erythritol kinase [Chryseosolibacter indicus]MBT1702717.1 4-(cytidine 5'-diphospho)-2-C-methyl-D-erythritol kinase [Chryseosolibacter indicus]
MITFPPCKINLGLNIISKRSDGYHDISTCFYPVPWTDILEVIPSNEFSFSTSGNIIPGDNDDNLCIKAYRLLKKDFSIPEVKIHLHKTIPTGAGLGGGSSDAAYCLRILNNIFNLNLGQQQLQAYASQIGSDCAFFIQDKPQLGMGRGEILSDIELTLKDKFLILIKPEIHVSTAEAYAGVSPAKPEQDLETLLIQTPLQSWKDLIKNDFEVSVFKKYPEIERIKQALYNLGALYASMSGSGASVFGIFSKDQSIPEKFKSMAHWSGQLLY